MRLDVHVAGRKVAQLFRERDEYVLAYLPEATPSDFVSLTMPVREAPWRWPRDLHPFFRQNLPEGFLLGVVREEFGRWLDGTDLSLLAVVGASGIGRVAVTPEGAQTAEIPEPLSVATLLQSDNSIEHFSGLVRRYARSAISGMVPKFMAPEVATDSRASLHGRPTFRTGRHIIKGSDQHTPFLGFNEHFSMKVLARLKVVPVAATRMSDDGQVLVVERFDIDSEGRAVYGLEDACSLLGLPPHEKYATTTEKVVNATRTYLSPENRQQQLRHLGWHLLLNNVVRNADCHAKNIALRYTQFSDVAFSPVYDVVTTQAYPQYALNPPALSVSGRKIWMAGKLLGQFFNARLGIAPREYASMVEQICESAVEVGQELLEAARNEKRWHGVAKQMLYAWNEGMTVLHDSGKGGACFSAGSRLTASIEAAGFSAPDVPEPTGTTIGRSELLAKPRRKLRK